MCKKKNKIKNHNLIQHTCVHLICFVISPTKKLDFCIKPTKLTLLKRNHHSKMAIQSDVDVHVYTIFLQPTLRSPMLNMI